MTKSRVPRVFLQPWQRLCVANSVTNCYRIAFLSCSKKMTFFMIWEMGITPFSCMCGGTPRSDRAVALERSEAVAVPYVEVVGALQTNPDLLRKLLELFCQSLADAYEQVNRLAVDDTSQRLTKVLLDLASKLGRPAGKGIEIPTYLTQEEISQMVAVRRERVSTALNSLRRRGIIQYSRGGHLVLDVRALERHAA
ncbi:MAG: hypothetical protein DMC59_09845 [Verrucomicrobia bacterium]|nr:MAG: hypothetical protein DMC59_09845 [Verrucomicrobiota bacterium]